MTGANQVFGSVQVGDLLTHDPPVNPIETDWIILLSLRGTYT